MADSSAPYRKLPGRGSGIVGSSTTWEGDSHLLIVKSWPSGESYRRFFYTDIQAIILRRTKRGAFWNWIFASFATVFLGMLIYGIIVERQWDINGLGGFAFILSLTVSWLVLLLVNTWLGPTCTLTIQTAIQYEPLPTVRRVRRARQLLARILPRIAAAQTAP